MRTTRTRIIAATAAGVLGLAGGVAIAQSQAATALSAAPADRVQSQLSIGGCVIRLYAAGPRIHANSSHTCVGVKSVGITGMGRLQVNYTQSGRTVGLTANADELLVARGIQAGVNGTTRYATITLYDSKLKRRLHLGRVGDYTRASGSTANIWFSSTRVRS